MEVYCLNDEERSRMAERLARIKKALKGKDGWHLEAEEQYGTLYVTLWKWWWRKPEWLDGLIDRMEINQRMKVSRFWFFGYGIKDCRLSCSLDIALGFIAAINTVESMPENTGIEDRITKGVLAMNSQMPHFGPNIAGQGSMG